MNRLIATTLAAAALAGVTAVPAAAHHSAVQFDFQNPVLVTGEVTRVRYANPHITFVLEVTDEARGTREIEFEGHSRNNMVRMGLTPNLFTVGETITVQIAPLRNGADGGYVTALITPEGEKIGNITGAD